MSEEDEKVSDMVRVSVGIMKKIRALGYKSATDYFKDLETGKTHTGTQDSHLKVLQLLEKQADLKARIASLEVENRFLGQQKEQLGSLPVTQDVALQTLQFEHRFTISRNEELEDRIKRLKKENEELEDTCRRTKTNAEEEILKAKREYNIVDKLGEVAPSMLGAIMEAKTQPVAQQLQGISSDNGMKEDDVFMVNSIYQTVPEEEIDNFRKMIFALADEDFRSHVFTLANKRLGN